MEPPQDPFQTFSGSACPRAPAMAWSPYSLTWNTSDSRTSRPSWPSPPLIPLANRPSVSLSELRDEILALDIPRDNPDYDIVVDACRRSGCEPRPSASSVFHDAWEGAVHTEGYVGLTGRTALHATHRELRLLTVEDGPTFPLDLIWRNITGTLRPVVAALVTAARDVRSEQSWV